MLRWFIQALVLVLVMLCGSAVSAQSHALRSTWRAPGVESFEFRGQKVAAVVISSDESLQYPGNAYLRHLLHLGRDD